MQRRKCPVKEIVSSKRRSVPDLIDTIINLDFEKVWCLSLGGRGKHSMDTFKAETSIFVQIKLIIRGFPWSVSLSRLEGKKVKITGEVR